MNKVLFVSYNHGYPNVADSVQNHRLIPALSRYYEIDILQRQVKGANEGVWSPNLYLVDRVLYKLFPFLFSIFSLDRWLWCRMAYNSLKKSLDKYQYIVMVYEPYTTRFLHYSFFKSRNELEIISLLYDPYVDNVFFNKKKLAITLRRKIEKKIIEQSDRIIVYNNKHFRFFKERYPNAKVYNLAFCGLQSIPSDFFDEHNFSKPLSLIHVGNIYGERKIDYINQVVTILKKSMPSLSKAFHIVIMGTYCVGYEKVIDAGNDDVIIHSAPLYGSDLLKSIKKADGLLLIDPMDVGNTCFPSKLCEYYQYKKPIFGFSAKGTPSYESLKESGHVVCDEKELSVMVKSISSFIDNHNVYCHSFNNSYGDRFYPKLIAVEFYKQLMKE